MTNLALSHAPRPAAVATQSSSMHDPKAFAWGCTLAVASACVPVVEAAKQSQVPCNLTASRAPEALSAPFPGPLEAHVSASLRSHHQRLHNQARRSMLRALLAANGTSPPVLVLTVPGDNAARPPQMLSPAALQADSRVCEVSSSEWCRQQRVVDSGDSSISSRSIQK